MQPEDTSPLPPPPAPETTPPAAVPQVIQPQVVTSDTMAPQVITPQVVTSPPEQPAPVVGQPAAPLPPQTFASQPLPPQPLAPIEPAGSTGGRKRSLIALVILVAFVFGGSALGLVLFKHPITRQQVTSAQKTADNFNNDVFKATDAINKAQDGDSVDSVKTNIDDANSKLGDAQKDFALLKKSNVLRDGDVKKSFNALDAKWKPYLTYLQGSAKDTQTILPPLLDFSDKISSISKLDTGSRSSQSSYLAQFKQIVDSSSQQITGLKLLLPEDKDIMAAFQADLNTSSTVIAKAQKDLSAGKPVYVIEDDILGVLDAQTTFTNKLNTIVDKANAKADKLDPSKEYDNFQNSLSKLWDKAKS